MTRPSREEILAALAADNEQIKRERERQLSTDQTEFVVVLASNGGNAVDHVVVYRRVEEDAEVITYGAFVGYCGGNSYDDGWFKILNGEATVACGGETEFVFEDLDEVSVFEECVEAIWELVEPGPDDGPYMQLSETGRSLTADDGRIVSEGFDGDMLQPASALWPIFLKF